MNVLFIMIQTISSIAGAFVGCFFDCQKVIIPIFVFVSIFNFISTVIKESVEDRISTKSCAQAFLKEISVLISVVIARVIEAFVINSQAHVLSTTLIFFVISREAINISSNVISLLPYMKTRLSNYLIDLRNEDNHYEDIKTVSLEEQDVTTGDYHDEDDSAADDKQAVEPDSRDDHDFITDGSTGGGDGCFEPIQDDERQKNEWLTISLGDDGETNTKVINEALKTSNVKINPGTYPISPGIVINGKTLDLRESHLISTKRFYSGTYIVLCGVSPCIRNGILSGLYVAAPGEEGYQQFEGECAIGLPVGGYTNAIIEDITLDHWCGAGVGSSGSNLLDEAASVRHTTPYTAPDDGWFRFDLTDGFRYITARHAIGYNYFISESNVIYHFVNRFGDVICEASGIPGEPIERPTDAVAVIAKTDLPTYVRYGLFEYLYDNTVSIMRCKFICNQRLGIANLAGDSLVKDCISRSNGFPREDHTGISHWDSSTSGFIDIEDIQTPRLTIENCSSENENLNIASRAYYLTVINSPKLTATAYDGWHVKARNSGKIKMLFSAIKHATLDTDGEVDDTVQLVNSKQVKHDFGTYPVLPSEGGGFYNCTFVIDRTAHLQYGKVANGTFSNCDITLNTDWILSHGTDPTLTFINCRIKTNGHYIIKQNVAKKGSLKFSGCVFDTTDTIACGPFIPTITISPEYPEL